MGHEKGYEGMEFDRVRRGEPSGQHSTGQPLNGRNDLKPFWLFWIPNNHFSAWHQQPSPDWNENE